MIVAPIANPRYSPPCPRWLRERIDIIVSESWNITYRDLLTRAGTMTGRPIRDLVDLRYNEGVRLLNWARRESS